ncbi:MAG TPA: crosslink repair DNA glycosylase YcaQ family protein [Armatimonadota bacterium]|nr:crosslink repair DNA glycosylase YcaQ family protein [Armatimonadota bacterium]
MPDEFSPIIGGRGATGEDSPIIGGRGAAGGRPELERIAGEIGGLVWRPNHVPFLSLLARAPDLDPAELLAALGGSEPALVAVSGPRAGFLFMPASETGPLARLAETTGHEDAERLIAPIPPEEVREAVRWIHAQIQGGGKTYPELRQGAPAAVLHSVERGSDRALHRETALQQVLLALHRRGDLLTTLALTGLNTSEGPYRYHLRTRLCLGPLPTPEEAYTRLASRYIHAFGPVGPRDFAVWSGLPEKVCRRAIGGVTEPLRTVAIAELGEQLLAPVSFWDRPALQEPICRVIPWMDHWLHAYRSLDRFAAETIGAGFAARDLALISVGAGVPAADILAVRIRLVGSAREPRLQPEPLRPLAAHEQAALQSELERVTAAFKVR